MYKAELTYSFSDRMLGLAKLSRPKQWVKNIFVFAPLIFAGAFLDSEAVSHAITAFILFCVGSSAAYIVNDIRDIGRDRQHATKSKTRPLAAGTVTVGMAYVLLIPLYAILAAAWFYQPNVVLVIVGYLLLNVAYSFFLKNQPVVDIFSIALGFVLRIYAGAVALSVSVSGWMFITTLCLALYLAAVKRRQELVQRGTEGRSVLKHYSVGLIDRYAEMAATGALVFYSMFVMSARPELTITIPFVLFGLFRYWFVVERLEGGESPTDVFLADWQLIATAGSWLVICGWKLWPA